MGIDIHIQYLKPTRNDICVAFCFFNTCGYVRPLQNLLFFENKLKAANIPYYSIEMVIGDQKPMLANPTLRVYSKSSMFYKEALWNRIEKEIPEQYTKICFLDSDIIFQRVDWLDSLSDMLDIHDIVHPFHILTYLDIQFTNQNKSNNVRQNIMSHIARKSINISDIRENAPGLGWAIKRSFLYKIGGFYDINMLGSSDQIFCGSIMKNKEMIESSLYPLIYESSLSYFNNLYNLDFSVSYLHCETLHLYHGNLKNRNYCNRIEIVKNIKDKWDIVYSKNLDGFFEINDESLNQRFYKYFIDRDEDDSNDSIHINDSSNNINLHIQYSKPTRSDICVAFAFFNSCGYVRPIQNLLLFENKLKAANIPYYSIEMVIGDQKPALANPTLRFYSKSALFYKEGLWNRLEKEIPKEYTKICFLDSDIIFDDPLWLDNISEMLDTHDLVHAFKTARLLNESYISAGNLISAIYRLNHSKNSGGAGYGWAIRRDFFLNLGGFFDMCILGAGDQVFYNFIYDVTYDLSADHLFTILSKKIAEYKASIQSLFPKVSYLNSNIYHLFHGVEKNRKYGSRYDILKNVEWTDTFIKNSNGFWESIDTNINMKCLEYFKERQEDSILSIEIAPKSHAPVKLAPVKLAPVELAPVKLAPVELAPVVAIPRPKNVLRPQHVASIAAAKSLQRVNNLRKTIVYDRTVYPKDEDDE